MYQVNRLRREAERAGSHALAHTVSGLSLRNQARKVMNKDTNKTGRESWVIPYSTHSLWVVTEEPRQEGHE